MTDLPPHLGCSSRLAYALPPNAFHHAKMTIDMFGVVPVARIGFIAFLLDLVEICVFKCFVHFAQDFFAMKCTESVKSKNYWNIRQIYGYRD